MCLLSLNRLIIKNHQLSNLTIIGLLDWIMTFLTTLTMMVVLHDSFSRFTPALLTTMSKPPNRAIVSLNTSKERKMRLTSWIMLGHVYTVFQNFKTSLPSNWSWLVTSHRRNMATLLPYFEFHSRIVSSPVFVFKSHMQT